MHEENGKPQNSTETGCVSSPSLRLVLLVLPAKGKLMSKIIDLTKVVEQSWASESRIQLKESGIPLTIRIQNPSSVEKKKTWNQYVLDYLVWDDID